MYVLGLVNRLAMEPSTGADMVPGSSPESLHRQFNGSPDGMKDLLVEEAGVLLQLHCPSLSVLRFVKLLTGHQISDLCQQDSSEEHSQQQK